MRTLARDTVLVDWDANFGCEVGEDAHRSRDDFALVLEELDPDVACVLVDEVLHVKCAAGGAMPHLLEVGVQDAWLCCGRVEMA